jgi:hypothetical protein
MDTTFFPLRLPLFYLFALAIVSFTACGEDDPVQDDSLLVGEWQATSGVQEGRTTNSGGGFNLALDFTSTLDNPEDYRVTFSSNPNVVTPSGNPSFTTVYTIDGNTTSMSLPVTEPLQPSTYEVSGNTITFIGANGERQDATLVTLTETELVLSGEFNFTQQTSGFNIEQRSEWKYRFER